MIKQANIIIGEINNTVKKVFDMLFERYQKVENAKNNIKDKNIKLYIFNILFDISNIIHHTPLLLH